jgi:hypothetical protein
MLPLKNEDIVRPIRVAMAARRDRPLCVADRLFELARAGERRAERVPRSRRARGDFHPACNIQRVCAEGAWRNYIFNGVKGQACGAAAPTQPANPPECPATLPSSEASCTPGPTCNYDAKQCTCGSGRWSCSTGKQYCKAPRPRIGTPCNTGDECLIEIKGPCDRFVLDCGREKTWTGSKSICL